MSQRRPYYLQAVPAPASASPSAAPSATVAEPVIGLVAIANRMRITVGQLKRMLYADSRRGRTLPDTPIQHVPGIGLAVDGPALDRWWAAVLRGEIRLEPAARPRGRTATRG